MKKTIAKQTKTDLVGCTAKPTILDNTTKLSIDTNASLPQDVIEAGLTSKLRVDELDKFTSISNNRNQIYTLIDTMAKDSDVSAIIKTYADTACSPNDNGHIVWCESEDPNISKFINYLLGVAAIDKKIYG